VRQYLRESVLCYFHHAGNLPHRHDEMAVVDTDLCARGITGPRVADASVMPTIVSANINAAVYAVAERAASLITA
jgi:choline dehydrogenase